MNILLEVGLAYLFYNVLNLHFVVLLTAQLAKYETLWNKSVRNDTVILNYESSGYSSVQAYISRLISVDENLIKPLPSYNVWRHHFSLL